MTKQWCKSTVSKTEAEGNKNESLPSMIVFDLDDCLWTPEMHELYDMPSIPVQGNLNPDHDGTSNKNKQERPNRAGKRKLHSNSSNCSSGPKSSESVAVSIHVTAAPDEIGTVGMRVPGTSQTVFLFDGARRALREIATDAKYNNVIIAAASSSLEPTYSHQCLNNIEIVQGVTMRDLFQYDEIGRVGHLTSSKTTHFQSLHRKSHVPYEEMLFFDDCNWGDHVQDVQDAFGVIGQRTPNGLQIEEFYTGLEKFHKSVQEL